MKKSFLDFTVAVTLKVYGSEYIMEKVNTFPKQLKNCDVVYSFLYQNELLGFIGFNEKKQQVLEILINNYYQSISTSKRSFAEHVFLLEHLEYEYDCYYHEHIEPIIERMPRAFKNK